MKFLSSRERRLWRIAAVYTLLIYASLYFVRGVAEFLRDRGLLVITLYVLFGLALAALLVWLGRQRPGWREIAVLLGVALAYAALLPLARAPEEQLHLLQYGLLSLVIYAALRERGSHSAEPLPWPLRWPAVTAFLATAALGWLDEGIQHLLPNRVYDLHDVAINAAAAALAMLAATARRWARRSAVT